MTAASEGWAASLRRNFTASSISSMSFSVPKALAKIRGAAKGSAERISMRPRAVGRQEERPSEKPAKGSGVRSGLVPLRAVIVLKA